MINGTVIEWKKKYGWIMPTETFEHPESEKHGGKIYVHMQDVQEGEMAKDSEVLFHVFVDSSGLGAEEVVVL